MIKNIILKRTSLKKEPNSEQHIILYEVCSPVTNLLKTYVEVGGVWNYWLLLRFKK